MTQTIDPNIIRDTILLSESDIVHTDIEGNMVRHGIEDTSRQVIIAQATAQKKKPDFLLMETPHPLAESLTRAITTVHTQARFTTTEDTTR